MNNFQPECTLPETPGFVEAPNARGTLDIIWSCFAIITLCTWSIIITHVPEELKEVPASGKLKSGLLKLGRVCYPGCIKLWWMIFTIMVPEFVMGKALNGFMRARAIESRKRTAECEEHMISSSFKQQLQLWTTSHSMLADIGGFAVDFRDLPCSASPSHHQLIPPTIGESGAGVPHENKILGGPATTEPSFPKRGASEKSVVMAASSSAHELMLDNHHNATPDLPANKPSIASQTEKSHGVPSNLDADNLASPITQSNTQTRKSISSQIGKSGLSGQGGDLTQPKPMEKAIGEEPQRAAERDPSAARPEDPLLTDFISGVEQTLQTLGGLVWQPHKDHRQLIDSLVAEGHIQESSSRKFEKWLKYPFYVLCGDRWILNAEQMLLAAERGLISLPKLSRQQLEDKSKSNGLVTSVALIQIAQLIAALLTRAIRGLSITQLEVVAVAYAACSIPTYILQWSCPKDVGIPIVVRALRLASKEDILAIGSEGKTRWWWGTILLTYSIPFLYSPYDLMYHDIGIILGTVVFGAFHLLAWGLTFPTDIEQLLWRITSLTITVIPLVTLAIIAPLLFLVLGQKRSSELWSTTLQVLSVWPMIATAFPFGAARIFLIVETFRALYFLPKDGYVATWTNSIPAIS